MPDETYPIIFAGAGPGDPDLITVKAKDALSTADRIIYAGSLVPEAVLKWASADSERLNSASMNLDEIVESMVSGYRAGLRVVRLHTGDPSLYGAIYEQMAELSGRSIPYTVIPGVTAAFAAAAAMGIEYTLPEISQTLILTRMAGRTPVPDTESLESLAAHRASMAIYLSVSLIDKVADTLAGAYGENAACAIAYRVSHPEETILHTRVKDLPRTVRDHGITRHALIIVGRVLEIAPDRLTHVSKLYDRSFSHGFRAGKAD